MHEDGSSYRVRVHDGEQWRGIEAAPGADLRRLLLRNDLSPYTEWPYTEWPYTEWTESLNCGGHGLCATCGAQVVDAPSSER